MKNPFFSNGRFISPSLNRLRIVDLPGFGLAKAYRNQTGFNLLSKRALLQLITNNQVGLKLSEECSLHTFDTCFESDATSVRATAVAIAEEYGRRLGIVLLTLKRGDAINHAARPEWDDRHWALWADIDTVYLGGGLVAGHLGQITAQTAQNHLRAAGFSTYCVVCSDDAAHLPLLGLTQLAPAHTQAMLVTDFGHSAVKRGLAIFVNGKLVDLDLLPSVPINNQESQAEAFSETAVAHFADWIVAVLADTWQLCLDMKLPLAPTVAVSMACYLSNGQPPQSEMGYYGRLQLLSDNVQMLLSDNLSTRLGQPMQLRMMHDASAAALTIPKIDGTVVVMLGTAVGNAFPAFNHYLT